MARVDHTNERRSRHAMNSGPQSPQLTSEASVRAPAPRKLLSTALVLSFATLAIYSNTFGVPFHWDDLSNIVQNEAVHDLRNLWPPSGTRWIGTLTFALNYSLGGLDVVGYHVVNVLIHLSNGLLVWWLAAVTLRTPVLRRASTGPLVQAYLPLAAAVLFIVHPIQTQAVTYIVQRYASLATLFYLLSIVLYAEARLSMDAARASKVRALSLLVLAVASAAAAMETKEISFTLPLVAVLYESLLFAPRRRWALLVPLAATALLIPVGLATQGRSLADVLGAATSVAETSTIPRDVYLLTQARVVLTYVRLLFLPVHQNIDYDYRVSDSLGDPAVLFALAVLALIAAVATAALVHARKTHRATGVVVFFGIAWFLITLSVESSIIPIRDVIFEHRMYLPSAGAAIAGAATMLGALERLRWRASLRAQAAGVLLLTGGPLALASYERNAVWGDDLALWRDAVSKSPGKARVHNNVGFAYKQKGQMEDAVREYREALRLDPALAQAHSNLGAVYQAAGDLEAAAREFGEAVRLDRAMVRERRERAGATDDRHAAAGGGPTPGPDRRNTARLAAAHNALCLAYRGRGRLDDALREYGEAVRLAPEIANGSDPCFASNAPGQPAPRAPPNLAHAHNELGLAYRASGQIEEAVQEFRNALRITPGMAEAHNNLGNAFKARAQLDDAVREFQEAIRIAPGLAEPHNNLGNVYNARGQTADAVREYRRAIQLNPKPQFILNLAVSLDDAGSSAEAATLYRRFLDLVGDGDPDAERVRHRLALLREAAPDASR